MSNPLHIISLGAGVQSSTMALMAAHGEITPMPHCAIFADTQNEPRAVYDWLGWLKEKLPFPIFTVSRGNLAQDTLRIRDSRDGKKRWITTGVPFHSINPDGTRGHCPRQCTRDYKIRPIMRFVRALLAENKCDYAVQWIGISLDEIHRMKMSRVKYAIHRWPLVEMRRRRSECLHWMESHGFPRPPRSACVMCPYHSNKEWRALTEYERAYAIGFEDRYREIRREIGENDQRFVHSSCVPLSQVDLTESKDLKHPDLFGNECEGMCGV